MVGGVFCGSGSGTVAVAVGSEYCVVVYLVGRGSWSVSATHFVVLQILYEHTTCSNT